MFTRKQFEQLNEKDLRERVVGPVLSKMGYGGVKLMHGSTEHGKDFVAWRLNESEERRNHAFVVKQGRIDGNAGTNKGSAANVSFQIRQCFNMPYRDPETGQPCTVHECWVITNGVILPTAIESIVANLPDGMARNVHFVDGGKLWKLYRRYYSAAAIISTVSELAEALPQSDHYVLKPSVSVSIAEKYPGASKIAPLTTRARFTFPDTEMGRTYRDGYERFRAEGGRFEIPANYVEQFEAPEIIREMFSDDVVPAPNIVFETEQPPVKLLLSMEVERQDGSKYVFPTNIELKPVQVGEVKVVLSNDHQHIPLKLKVTLSKDESTASINFTFAPPANVKQMVDWLRLRVACEHSKSLMLASVETGMPLFGSSLAMFAKKDPSLQDYLEELEDLLAVQQHVHIPITIPSFKVGAKDNRTISLLRAVIHRTAWEGTWSRFSVELFPEGVRIILDNMQKEGKKYLLGEQDVTVELFGQAIPMGRVRHTMRDVVLVDEAKVRRQLAASKSEDKSIRVDFKVGEDSTTEVDYLEWHPGAERIDAPALLGTAVEEHSIEPEELKPPA